MSQLRPFLKSKKKAKSSQNHVEFSTTEDILNRGAEEEEAGDRFMLSDLSKSLRFYQKAFDYYLRAADMTLSLRLRLHTSEEDAPQLLLDCMYNSSRLLFHVYNEFVKDDIINFSIDIKNIDNVVNSQNLILQTLPSILQKHEDAIKMHQLQSASTPHFPWDLYYNTCLVYTELIEDANDDALLLVDLQQYATRTVLLFKQILEFQVAELTSLIADLTDKRPDEMQHLHESHDENSLEEYLTQESIVPSTVLETIISVYSFIHAFYEAVTLNNAYRQQLNPDVTVQIRQLAQMVDTVLHELVTRFHKTNTVESEPILGNLEEKQLVQLEIIKTAVSGLETESLNALIQLWDKKILEIGVSSPAEDAEMFAEKYLVIADNFQNFYDRNEIGDVETHWKLLSTLTVYYRKAQDVYTHLLKQTQAKVQLNANNSADISPLVVQLATILMARADVDVVRLHHVGFASFPTRHAAQPVLEKNVQVCLKNALAYLSLNCGLREKLVDKLSRRQKRYQAMARQYILGIVPNLSASSNDEKTLVKIEVEGLRDLDAYKGFSFP